MTTGHRTQINVLKVTYGRSTWYESVLCQFVLSLFSMYQCWSSTFLSTPRMIQNIVCSLNEYALGRFVQRDSLKNANTVMDFICVSNSSALHCKQFHYCFCSAVLFFDQKCSQIYLWYHDKLWGQPKDVHCGRNSTAPCLLLSGGGVAEKTGNDKLVILGSFKILHRYDVQNNRKMFSEQYPKVQNCTVHQVACITDHSRRFSFVFLTCMSFVLAWHIIA